MPMLFKRALISVKSFDFPFFTIKKLPSTIKLHGTVECLYKDGHFGRKVCRGARTNGPFFPKVCRCSYKDERSEIGSSL